jgi:hypothetical protein
MPSLEKDNGWLMVDNRCAGEGIKEFHTMSCSHCGGHVVLNPQRIRARAYCRSCNHYICDTCAATAAQPSYQHTSFQELTDKVRSGKFAVVGGTYSAPILIPIT